MGFVAIMYSRVGSRREHLDSPPFLSARLCGEELMSRAA